MDQAYTPEIPALGRGRRVQVPQPRARFGISNRSLAWTLDG